MSSIDERIVSMRFNNGQFESGIKQTMQSLTGLKSGLDLDASTKSLEGLSNAGRNFTLGPISAGVEHVSGKFLALATIGITTLTNIANKALSAGQQLVSSLTVDPIKMGLEEYETNLNSIQTIMANTSAKGSTLEDVNGALAELNAYSDQTIYNFAEMSRNIGTFTAAGVDLDTSTSAIKGIANLAAVSGSNSEQASTAMYQLSQALSTGKVALMDWNSVTNAGMGGEVFQNAIKDTARAHGVAVDSIIKDSGSFRDSLQEGWFTSDILIDTLSTFTGDLSDAQLESMGYTSDQIAGIQQMATTAKDAATKVKTVSQLVGTLQEGAQSGWAQSWQYIFGDFEQAKELFTGVNNVLGGMIGASAEARNAVLKEWESLGGRTDLIEGVKNAFNAFMGIVTPIKEAFREFFPTKTAYDLLALTADFKEFTARLIPTEDTIDKLKRTFRGLFALFSLARSIVLNIVQVFGKLFGAIFEGSGTILDTTANWGDLVAAWASSLQYSGKISKFFSSVSDAMVMTIGVIKDLGGWLAGLFKGDMDLNGDAVLGLFDKMKVRLEPLQGLLNFVSAAWEKMSGWFSTAWTFMLPLSEKMSEFFGGLGSMISEGLANMDYSAALDGINTGLLAGIGLLFAKFLGGGMNVNIGDGFLEKIGDAFDGLTGTMSAMQAQLKAGTLLKIAGAIALLTVSVVALSMIDSAKLTTALAAMTAMFTQLLGAMAIVAKISASPGLVKMPFVAGALILFSAAILVLTFAVRNLSGLDWQELAKGLTGVTVLLGALAGVAKVLSTGAPGMVTAGVGMIAIAIAIKVLVSAVEDFAAMSWEELAKGLASVGAALTALAIFTRLSQLNQAGLAQSAGLILIAVALKVIASAVKQFAAMDWETLGRGFAAMAAALLVIAGAMHLMPANMMVSAASLVVVAGALLILGEVLEDLGGMTWEEIAKGLATLAGSLVIIAGAMMLMTSALAGAAALLVVAGSLAILTPILETLGAMSWQEILTGLATLAGIFLVLGAAGLVLTPVIPSLLGLGAAIMLIGIGTALAGVGLLAFSVGLTAISLAGGAAATAIVAIVGAIIGLIPTAMTALGNGIVAFAGVIGGAGPTFVTAMVTLITSLLTAINTVAPLIIETMLNLIYLLLNTLVENVPQFVEKGMQLIQGLLDGIAKNLPGVIASAVNLLVQFIKGIEDGIPDLVDAAADLVVTFVESIATAVEDNADDLATAAVDIADAIIDGVVGGIADGASRAANAVKDWAGGLLDSAKGALGINSPSKEFYKIGEWSTEGLANALSDTSGIVKQAGAGVGDTALSAVKKSMARIAEAVSSDIDMTPTIRPVVDLSDVAKSSSLIDGMLTPGSISTSGAYNKAATISADVRQNQTVAESTANLNGMDKGITFVQHNTSPRALSHIELYRQTNNQISAAKGVLRG